MASHTPTPPIAIIGAGPCGLVLARLLELARVPYIVFERDASSAPHPHHQGGSLDIHTGTGQAALEAAGLKAEFEKLARHEGSVFTIRDSQNVEHFRFGGGDGAEHTSDRPEIDRRQLRSILLDSIPAHRVRWGKALRAVERADAGAGTDAGAGAGSWVLRFADGSSETGFRMIVGADGAWSKVRPLLTSAKPYYSGKTYVEGRLSETNPIYAAAQQLAGAGMFMAIGAGRLIVLQQMADRTYRLYAGLREPESLTQAGGAIDFAADIEKAKTALLELYSDWAPDLRTLIENAEEPWRAWPLYTFAPEAFAPEAEERTWTRVPGVTLLGDAVHLSIPNGEGVNLAMVDALRLFESLSTELGFGLTDGNKNASNKSIYNAKTDGAAIERAIAAYETAMRKSAYEHVEDGIKMSDAMFHSDGAAHMVAMFTQFSEQPGQS
ncbi:monooxygenase [Nemania sp. NC0429]|nr:monooxygenase [Nemania sp. NC0429]